MFIYYIVSISAFVASLFFFYKSIVIDVFTFAFLSLIVNNIINFISYRNGGENWLVTLIPKEKRNDETIELLKKYFMLWDTITIPVLLPFLVYLPKIRFVVFLLVCLAFFVILFLIAVRYKSKGK